MSRLYIIDTDFTLATALSDLLTRRRVLFEMSNELPSEKISALVCSAAYEATNGGQKAFLDIVRKLGVQKLVIVDDQAETTETQSEMGGRIVRVAIEPNKAPALLNGGLLMLAEMVASDRGFMVAADNNTGQLIDMATRVAKTDVTVFINGPTGSGKEVLARLVHTQSPRADKPFVAINCAAIPENMLEAILFGHEKGSFTGAATANKGIVRAADGGTLFLDEVTEMPLGLQSKLLRVLQEKTVTPLGSQKEEKVDIRIIATSNRDMIHAVRAGTFREDLYYRLNVFPLSTQALCERPDDIPALAVAMVRRHVGENASLPLITENALKQLVDYDWPGNVRELENIVQRALVMCDGQTITQHDIMIHSIPTTAAQLPPVSQALAAV